MKSAVILSNCKMLLTESVHSFEKMFFPRSCFLAMTAIEEAGKFSYLFLHPGSTLEPPILEVLIDSETPRFEEMTDRDIREILRNHPGKALKAAELTLANNEAAKKRYGKDRRTHDFWSLGIKRIIDRNDWMPLRNACLYVDWGTFLCPEEIVSLAHASYMICMGHEIVADLVDIHFVGEEEQWNPEGAAMDRYDMIRRLETFVSSQGVIRNWEGLNLKDILARRPSLRPNSQS